MKEKKNMDLICVFESFEETLTFAIWVRTQAAEKRRGFCLKRNRCVVRKKATARNEGRDDDESRLLSTFHEAAGQFGALSLGNDGLKASYKEHSA